MIEVWRPGRMGDRRRGQTRQRGRAKPIRGEPSGRKPLPEPAASDAGAPVLASAQDAAETSTPSVDTEAHAKRRHLVRQRRPEHRMERQEDRQYRQKHERPPGKRFEPREKRPDPNSPFAKLAALKEQLEADAKERR